jgi:hypothetical protein
LYVQKFVASGSNVKYEEYGEMGTHEAFPLTLLLNLSLLIGIFPAVLKESFVVLIFKNVEKRDISLKVVTIARKFGLNAAKCKSISFIRNKKPIGFDYRIGGHELQHV